MISIIVDGKRIIDGIVVVVLCEKYRFSSRLAGGKGLQ